MAISIKRLLEDYFYVEDLQDALDDIGETISGTKSELIKRLLGSWFEKNRTLKDLLDFLPEEGLLDLCQDFKIDPDGEHDTLVRRILKSNVIQSHDNIRVPSSKVNDYPQGKPSLEMPRQEQPKPKHEVSEKTKRRLIWAGIGGAAVVIGLVVSLVTLYDRIFPPPSHADLTLDVISPDANIMIDRQPYLIQFAPEITAQPINGEITLVINNIGNAPAKNVYIEYLHEPQVNNWYDHRTTVVEQGAVQDRGSNQGYQGTLKVGDTIRIKYLFTINPLLYPEANLNSPTLTFHVMYDDNREVLKQYLVCFDDCAEKLENS